MPPKKSSRSWRLRLEDMVSAIHRIITYASGVSFEEFEADDMRVDAVIRNFGVLGEAARHAPAEVETAHPAVPWRKMRDMRNVVVHSYHAVTMKTLWDTTRDDLPFLLSQLEAMLAELDALEEGDRC